MLETELYEPIKILFEKNGYHIKAEVSHLDMFGIGQDGTVAIELKTSVSLKLIYQAMDRMRIADKVYVGLPKRAMTAHRSDVPHLKAMLKRLGIGLVVVDQDTAYIAQEADMSTHKRKAPKKKQHVIDEFNQRQNHQNVGGTKGKILTAYKEKVIRVAYMLHKMKSASPKQLAEQTGISQASSILQKNYEGWFERVDRGQYRLTLTGEKALLEYLKLLDLQ